MIAPTSASLDRTFETLSDEKRRHMLHYLSESSDGTATVHELTELLGGDSRRTEIRLRHVHIPNLRASCDSRLRRPNGNDSVSGKSAFWNGYLATVSKSTPRVRDDPGKPVVGVRFAEDTRLLSLPPDW